MTESSLALKLAPWLTSDVATSLWVLGLAGMLGALAVTFPLVGGAFPGTLGATKMQKAWAELQLDKDEYRQRRNDGVESDRDGEELHNYIVRMESILGRREIWQFIAAGMLYVAIGFALSALFAQDVFQALLYGAGGPTIVGQLISRGHRTAIEAEKNEALKLANRVIQGAPNIEKLKVAAARLVQDPKDQKALATLAEATNAAPALHEEEMRKLQKAKYL